VKTFFSVKNLEASVDGKTILYGINLDIQPGQVHALMGPNGSGKSTLASTIMGHPRYKVDQGSVVFHGQDLLALSPDKRAQLGLFLSFQHAPEIDGVIFKDLLRQAYNAVHGDTEKKLNLKEFNQYLNKNMKLLGMDLAMLRRSINTGFSGGEKKRAEMLQLAVLQPKLAVLDEIDSGLDIDAIKTVCQALLAIKKENPEMALLIITHNFRIFEFLKPDVVHIFKNGKIIKTGSSELLQDVASKGFEEYS